MADAESLSCDHTQHKPGHITCRKQWEQQIPLKKWTIWALWSSRVSRSQVRMRQKIRERWSPLPLCVWQVLSSVRDPMGPDGHWHPVADCDNTLRTCLSWAVSLTHDLLPARKYRLPKESWFYMFHLPGGCKTCWWEEKLEICLSRSRTQTCSKSSCRRKEMRELCLGAQQPEGRSVARNHNVYVSTC